MNPQNASKNAPHAVSTIKKYFFSSFSIKPPQEFVFQKRCNSLILK